MAELSSPPTSVSKVEANWSIGALWAPLTLIQVLPWEPTEGLFFTLGTVAPEVQAGRGAQITARGCLGKWAGVQPAETKRSQGRFLLALLCSSTGCPRGTLGHHPSRSSVAGGIGTFGFPAIVGP